MSPVGPAPTSAGDVPLLGVMFANGAASASPQHAVALAQAAELNGFESLWAVQHVVIPLEHASRYPYAGSGQIPGGTQVAIPDPFVWLAFVAGSTVTIRLATGIVVLPQQHALVIAKQVATLDRLSGGRCILGVGAGWLREEFEALGASFDDRGSRLDEQIEVLRRAWSQPVVRHEGQSMSFGDVVVEPKPHAASVPIVIGGHTAAAARRAGRLGDGFFPLGVRGPELVRLAEVAQQAAVDAGRTPGSVELTADAPRTEEEAVAVRTAGVDRVVINAPQVPTDGLADALHDRVSSIRSLFSATAGV